nr:hypothetical protein Iba_chr08eCG12160 [Ipomoea batatas]
MAANNRIENEKSLARTEKINHPFNKIHNTQLPLSLFISELPQKESYFEAQVGVPDRGKRDAIAAMAAKPVLIRVAPPRYGSVNLNCPDE